MMDQMVGQGAIIDVRAGNDPRRGDLFPWRAPFHHQWRPLGKFLPILG
jgi:hypothetical protein